MPPEIRREGKPGSESELFRTATPGGLPTSIKIVLSLTIKSAVAVPPPWFCADGDRSSRHGRVAVGFATSRAATVAFDGSISDKA